MDAHTTVSELRRLFQELGKAPTWREYLAAGNTEWSVKKFFGTYTAALAASGIDKTKESLSPSTVRKPKILLIDIETSTMVVETYGLFDQNIPITKISRDWFVLSFAARFVGETECHYLDLRYEPDLNDEMLLVAIHHLLSQADIVMGHNVKRFDIKKINARFLKHGIRPPSSYRVIDTFSIAKKNFALSSNKLDYLAKYLGCTPKYKSRRFSQEEMWQECIKGNIDAWKENEAYNIRDIDTLEEVWNKLKAWDRTINFSIYAGEDVCPCGACEFKTIENKVTNAGVYPRKICEKCGFELVSRENLLDKDKKPYRL